MRPVLVAHDELLGSAVEGRGGWLFKLTGDGVCKAFLATIGVTSVTAFPKFDLPVAGRFDSQWRRTFLNGEP
jgi:hypothetical protein